MPCGYEFMVAYLCYEPIRVVQGFVLETHGASTERREALPDRSSGAPGQTVIGALSVIIIQW